MKKTHEYGLKWHFSWVRGKAKDSIRRMWKTNKGINFYNFRQIWPGDSYYKNDNWVQKANCHPRSINVREGTIVHHCVLENLRKKTVTVWTGYGMEDNGLETSLEKTRWLGALAWNAGIGMSNLWWLKL